MNAELHEALAKARVTPWWHTQLPPLIENRFFLESAAARRRQFLFWARVNFLISVLVLGLDAMTMPDIWDFAVMLRLGVIMPVGLMSLYVLRRPRTLWVEELAAVGPSHLSALAGLVLFGLSESFEVAKGGTVLAAVVVLGNVLFPIRLKQAVAFSLVTMLIGDAVNLLFIFNHGVHTTIAPLFIFSHTAVLVSLVARGVAERETRFSFVRGLELQIRADTLAHSNEQLLELASTDALTGLANRRHFDQTFEKAWHVAVDVHSAIAIMLIDVDYFKAFNDTCGHLEGDRCLIKVARILAGQVRQERDLVARYGGEEFVVLMPITQIDTAEIIAERIRNTIADEKISHPGRPDQCLFVSVSIGIAAVTPDIIKSVSPTTLLAAADACLYRAKASGRNRVICNDNALLAAARLA